MVFLNSSDGKEGEFYVENGESGVIEQYSVDVKI